MPRAHLSYLIFVLTHLIAGPTIVHAEEELASEPGAVGRDTTLTIRRGDSLSGIAARFLSLSPSYTRQELVGEIRRYNDLASDTLMPGQQILVPLGNGQPLNRTVIKASDYEAKGIYVNAQVAGNARIQELADQLVAAGGNTVVFDAKNRLGNLSYASQVELAVAIGAGQETTIQQPAKLIDFLHRRQLHAVARIVCFYDTRLARERPDLVPLSRRNRNLWSEREEACWVDPSLPEVQDYLLALIREVAAMGVDEIQLDYIRFPTEGDVKDAVFAFDPAVLPKYEVITAFLGRVREALEPTDVLLSADIFGVVAWGREADAMSTGQKLSTMLPLLDVVSPMLYPSHFYGTFEQVPNPVDYPYYFVYRGCQQLRDLAFEHGVIIRPWIQSFAYRVTRFDARYITEQLHGAEDGGARGWLLWNSASRYEVGLAAIDRFTHAPADSTLPEDRFPTVESKEPSSEEPLGARLQESSEAIH